ncbi:ABC-type transport system, periplasmic component [Janthinobacterium sp. Marseille]|nr:substrate-binding domain-containing protein [Janthinobacterium sp. Marseille]ABR90698.1 ABC-type transport system, periplasmic component [Janthinobacterium sp. Marseille]
MKELRILADACFDAQVAKAVERFNASHTDIRAVVSAAGAADCLQRLKAGDSYDLVILADSAVAAALMPGQTDGYYIFAGNSMVLAYAPGQILNAKNWREKLGDAKASIGHLEPSAHSAGYAALMACMLADSVAPGLTRILVNHPGRKVVTPASEATDFAFRYRTECIAKKISYASLPDTMDLSNPAFNAHYATAKHDLSGDGKTIVKGSSIAHALAIPLSAEEPEAARDFIEVLLQNNFTAQGFLPRSEIVGKSPCRMHAALEVKKPARVQSANYEDEADVHLLERARLGKRSQDLAKAA